MTGDRYCHLTADTGSSRRKHKQSPTGRQLGCTCSVCTFRYTSTPPFTHTHAHADIDCRVGTLWLHCMSKPSAGRTLIVSSCVCVCVFCWSFRHGCWLNCIQRLIVWFGGRLSIVYCNVHCVIKGNHQEVEWWCPRLVQHPWGDHQTLSDCIPIRLVVETNTFCGVSRYCRRGKRIRYTSSPENTYITYLVERGDNQKPRSIFLWPTDNEWLPWVYSQPCVGTLLHVKENRRVKPLHIAAVDVSQRDSFVNNTHTRRTSNDHQVIDCAVDGSITSSK